MPIPILYTLNLLLFLSCLLALTIEKKDQRASLSLIQILAALPLLAAHYFLAARYLTDPSTYLLLLYAESIFALVWLTMSVRMTVFTGMGRVESRLLTLMALFFGSVLTALALYHWNNPPPIEIVDEALLATPYGWIYFYALFLLLTILVAAWQLEVFWRTVDTTARWMYKFFMVGGFLACAALVWAASYRLTYMRLVPNHLYLLSTLIVLAWVLIAYAIIRHRLLNRKIFISRKIIYSFVAPTIFAAYLLVLGIISLIIKTYGLTLPYVLQWLALVSGLILFGLFLFSPTLRRRIHFFISTHFYINKYEYRDEWLALSARLQGATDEEKVVQALYEVLKDSFYATHILIWTGDEDHGYDAFTSDSTAPDHPPGPAINPKDPIVHHLKTHSYFYSQERSLDRSQQLPATVQSDLLKTLNLVLLAPLYAGDQLVGIIGLGPEFTGGRYGRDDFDLLAALGTQTATALVAVRMAEKLAHARERQAWDRLAAFVLHDIKNAATMLSLVRTNAPANIHHPDFQQDMLEAIDDALARMVKVQQRLDVLKEESIPAWEQLALHEFLHNHCREISKRLDNMTIRIDCPSDLYIRTDPRFLSRIIENLLLNALEAGGDPATVDITVHANPTRQMAILTFTDNGPGIVDQLLPDTLFEPLKTTKPHGSGIGLWQVKQLVAGLQGTIEAVNTPENHAQFIIGLPLHRR